MDTLTYDDVMFDWAVAELFSPSWGALWSFPRHDTLRDKIRKAGTEALTVYEKTYLVERLREFRMPVIALYGPERNWGFRRETVTREALAQYSILASFEAPHFWLGALAEDVRENPRAHEALYEPALEIADMRRKGQTLHGTPIAIARPAPWPPILLAGYKRCVAFLWNTKEKAIDVHLCG